MFLIGIVQPQSVLEVSTQYLDILLEENATVTLYLRLGKICYALTTVLIYNVCFYGAGRNDFDPGNIRAIGRGGP